MINVETSVKVRLAQKGANKLFQEEYNNRQKMTDEELINIFDKAWNEYLQSLIINGDLITYDDVVRRLTREQNTYVRSTQEHRSFRYDEAMFIVQLQRSDDKNHTLTQLWLVKSSDIYPTTLFITFDTIEDKKLFTDLAEMLQTSDEKLGLQLIHNFMNLHPHCKVTL